MKAISNSSLFRSLDQSGCGAITAADILQVLAQSGLAPGDARRAQRSARGQSEKGGGDDGKRLESREGAGGPVGGRARGGGQIIPGEANI
jgi:hypothetical protein